MKVMAGDRERLLHMLEALDRIIEFTDQMTNETFLSNAMAQFAVIKNFQIIGEAAYHVSQETKRQCPKVEWRKIEAFRNKLVHDYYQIDLEIVWKSKEDKLDRLKEQIKQILEKSTKEE